MSSAPLNIFQRLMRRWDQRHPYNAAQVMRLAGKADAAQWDRAWRETLTTAGLGPVRTDAKEYWFESLNGHAEARVALIPSPGTPGEGQGEGDFSSANNAHLQSNSSSPPALSRITGRRGQSKARLSEHLSAELNRPFSETGQVPFRPFVIQNADDFFAGVVYQHWIADSVATRMLMRDWFVRVYDPLAARRSPMRLPTQSFWNSIGPHRGGWEMTESLLTLGRRHTRLRRVRKIDSTGLTDPTTRFILIPVADGFIGQLRQAAAGRGLKLNDIFLAALAQACARHMPMQRRRNRPDLAVGSVVDLRPFCPDDLSQTMGLYLGFTNVVCRPRDLTDFNRLVKVVSNQTRLQKSTGVAPASLMWMAAATAIGKMSRLDELYHFYRKELPLAGGISNVDLTHGWMSQYHPSPLLDYIRVSPTGPMAPLVLTTTTLGRRFHIGLTHRVGLIQPDLARQIGRCFLVTLSDVSRRLDSGR